MNIIINLSFLLGVKNSLQFYVKSNDKRVLVQLMELLVVVQHRKAFFSREDTTFLAKVYILIYQRVEKRTPSHQ